MNKRCPKCGELLEVDGDYLTCFDLSCGHVESIKKLVTDTHNERLEELSRTLAGFNDD